MRRGRGGPDRFVYWKLALFFLGAGFLVAGMATGRDWAVAVAIGVLALGLLLRFLPQGGSVEEEPPPGE